MFLDYAGKAEKRRERHEVDSQKKRQRINDCCIFTVKSVFFITACPFGMDVLHFVLR